jgi:hypothetical protein
VGNSSLLPKSFLKQKIIFPERLFVLFRLAKEETKSGMKLGFYISRSDCTLQFIAAMLPSGNFVSDAANS